jgi:hypothetical protein
LQEKRQLEIMGDVEDGEQTNNVDAVDADELGEEG